MKKRVRFYCHGCGAVFPQIVDVDYEIVKNPRLSRTIYSRCPYCFRKVVEII